MEATTDERALAVARSAEIAQAGAPTEIVRLAHIDPDLAKRALAIIFSRPVDQYNPPLQPARAIAAALYEAQTGQICGRDFFVDNLMGIVPGYRGRVKEADDRGVSDYLDDYRPFRADENQEHEIKPGDTAKVCELTVISRAKACREVGIPYRPTIGFGIVRASEKVNKEGRPIALKGGYTWERKARNRALKDALSHAGFAKNAHEVIEDAQNEGLDLGHDDEFLGKLTRDQAAYVVEGAQRKQLQAYRQAEQQAEALLMQADEAAGSAERNAFEVPPEDHDAELTLISGAQAAANDAAFADIPSAQDERKAQARQSPQVQKQPRLARIIGNPGFSAYAAPFVKDFPHYANKQGVFDTEHILARVFQLGFAVIDVSNIAAVFAALREYATEQAALPKE